MSAVCYRVHQPSMRFHVALEELLMLRHLLRSVFYFESERVGAWVSRAVSELCNYCCTYVAMFL